MEGVLTRDPEPALWALTQTYRAPDGAERVRHGFFCRVRITDYGPGLIRPHERTHPGGQGGPPAADARDAREPLADLLALPRPRRRRVVGARAGDRRQRRGAR